MIMRPAAPREAMPSGAFKEEVWSWSRRIGAEPKEVHVRPMRRKWASCSSRGRLTFDSGLLKEPAPFRAEVIVHELLHLKIPNHSKVFRALLRTYLAEPQIGPCENESVPRQTRRKIRSS